MFWLPFLDIPIITIWHVNLFIATLLSASIIPLPSEPAIVLSLKVMGPLEVFFIAVIGSMLGSVSNYYIGFRGVHNWLAKRDPKAEKRAEDLINKYGFSILLVAPWVPFVGDPLLIVAGALEMKFFRFFVWVLVARMIKVGLLLYFGVEFFGISMN
ncbi:MAG: VTT domain-containing protein [Candidatus Micrarchaeota archaeon]